MPSKMEGKKASEMVWLGGAAYRMLSLSPRATFVRRLSCDSPKTGFGYA